MYHKIKAPKFKIGRYSLNEYELRYLMLEVAKGLKPSGITVKDIIGDTALILQDGTLDKNLVGMGFNSRLTLNLIAQNRLNK